MADSLRTEQAAGKPETEELETSLSRMEEELYEKYCRIGKGILETMEEENKKINTLVDNIITTRRLLAAARQERACPSCLTLNGPDSLYCKRCGEKLPEPQEENYHA
ncbi:hypothetical protein LJC14_03945 [Treponema sp. OttesenSCG-928-L16]|nr:hypothetical protein [Treponema sp. OttesenSCG-928-L16]